MQLDNVKAVIYRTDCKKYILEGLSCSEPIMTKQEGKIVDNYFTYSQDENHQKISEPIIGFGIFTEDEKTVYIRKFSNEWDCKVLDEEFFDIDKAVKIYDEYVRIYPLVRSCVYSNKLSQEQMEYLSKYLSYLRIISGEIIWKTYKELYPEFFEWVQKIIRK